MENNSLPLAQREIKTGVPEGLRVWYGGVLLMALDLWSTGRSFRRLHQVSRIPEGVSMNIWGLLLIDVLSSPNQQCQSTEVVYDRPYINAYSLNRSFDRPLRIQLRDSVARQSHNRQRSFIRIEATYNWTHGVWIGRCSGCILRGASYRTHTRIYNSTVSDYQSVWRQYHRICKQ